MGLVDGFGVGLAFLVLVERPVDAGQAGVAAFAFAGGDDQVRADVLHGLTVRAAAQHGVQHVVGDHRRASAVVSLAGRGVEAFEGGLADVLAFGFGHRGEEREQHPTGAGRIVDAGQGPGEHFQGYSVRGEVVGQRSQLGGIPAKAFHLVDGEDDTAVRGVGLDLPGSFQGGFELRADPHAGGDLLGEDLVAWDAVRGQRIELRLEFLGQVRAPRIADADVRARRVRREWRRRRRARSPRLTRSPVGRDRHAQLFRQARDFGEPAGVVGRGDRSGAGPARRAGLDVAAGALMPFDFVSVGLVCGFGLAAHPEIVSQTFLITSPMRFLSENGF